MQPYVAAKVLYFPATGIYTGGEVIDMTLGENLQRLRKAKGLSQDEVAEKLFLTRQSVSKWENNQAEPGVEKLKALAGLYSVSVDELVGNISADGAQDQGEGQTPEEFYRSILALRMVTAVAGCFAIEDGLFVYCLDWFAMAVGCRVRNRLMWGLILVLEGTSLFAHLLLTVKMFWYVLDRSFITLLITAVNGLIFVLSCQGKIKRYFIVKDGSV